MADEQRDFRLRAWSYRRQGLDRSAIPAIDTLERAVAVYSSNPTAPLSLLARSSAISSADVASLEQERQAIRLPAMRGSIFLMPVSTAPEILAATAVPLKKLQSRLDYGDISGGDYERIKEKFLNIATAPMTVDELQSAIPVDGKLMVAIRVLAYESLALRVGDGLRSDHFRYVAAPAWLGQQIEPEDPEQSLKWLASEYLRSFGPVRPTDFAWWAGVTKGRARNAFEALDAVDVGDGLLLHSSDVTDWEQTEPLEGDEIAILPKWDAYTMGYPAESRERFVRQEHQVLAFPKIRATSGDGAPLILRGGLAVASWGHRFQGDRMTVSVAPFDPGDSLEWLSASDFESAGAMLGASDLSLTSC